MSRIPHWPRAAAALLLAALLAPASHAGRAADVRTESFRLLNEGVAAYRRGDFAAAVDRLDRAAGMALNNFRAYYYLGLALIGDRRYEKAAEALAVALDLDPDHLQSHVALGDARLKLGDLDSARASYYLALKLRPEYPAALDGLARIFEAEAEGEQARAYYLRALAQDRGFAPAYTHLGDLYLRENRFEEAVQLLEEAVSVRPDFADGLNRLARAYARLGLHNEAVATIRRAIELEPANASHPAALGQVELEEGFVAAGERAFVHALQLDPALPEARAGLAEVARRRGDYDLALGQLDGALADSRLDALKAQDIRAFRERVETERDRIAALEARTKEAAATPDDFAALAAIYAGRADWQHAAELQRHAGDGAGREEMLAYLLFRAGRYREAFELYSRLAASAARPELEINTGVSAALLGEDAVALEAYDRALALDPGASLALLYRGNALLRLGRIEEGVESYVGYLGRKSDGEDAERVRRILSQIAPQRLPPPPAPLEPVPTAPAEAPSDDERPT